MRTAAFDPTAAGDTATQQWLRYDWRLLREGHVFRYDRADDLAAAGSALGELGYLVRRADAGSWSAKSDVHGGLADALSFPEYYGANLDAFIDALRDVADYSCGADPATTGTVLLIQSYQRVVEMDGQFAHAVLDEFARVARLGLVFGHPMLCLVECAVDLDPVGATAVTRADLPAR
ncbi:MAG TPA: barstar family protein [Pseudonocardia sp.]|jgi:hypothetical protein|nr:barstar family protein [Pseudonocardia sp.]